MQDFGHRNCAPATEEVVPLSTSDAPEAVDRWKGYGLGGVALFVVLIKACAILCGIGSAHLATLLHRAYEVDYHHYQHIARWKDEQDLRFFELWVASDAQWYLAIAENGYPDRQDLAATERSDLRMIERRRDAVLKYAFFPAWPMVIRATQFLIADVNAAGFVASNVLSFVALLVLYRLVAARMGREIGFWTTILFAASPFAMFLHVPFSESLFLLLAVLTFVACARESWWMVGILVGLGVVTRPNGIAMGAVPVAYLIVQGVRRPDWLRAQFPKVCWLAVAAVPLGLFLWHNHVKTGNAFQFAKVISWWGYGDTTMPENLWANTVGSVLRFSELPLHNFHASKVDVAVLVLAVAAWFAGLRKLPLHYSVYALCIIAIPLLTKSDLMSYSRYVLMAWPLWCALVASVPARWRTRVCAGLGVVFLLFQMVNVDGFVNWYWVA